MMTPLARFPSLEPAGRFLRTFGWLLAVQATLVFAFVYPGYHPDPHHVPVGVVGPRAAVASVEAKAGGSFDVTRYASERAARSAIDRREVYGALVVDRSGNHLLVASAASFTVAQLLRGLAERSRPHVDVHDVKPLDAQDPRGATINLMFLPLVGVCLSAVLALAALGLSRRRLVGAVGLFSVLGGLSATAVVAECLGALPGSYVALSGVTAMTILAIALPVAGLHRLLGKAGILVGSAFFLVIANPASGNGTAPELLPNVWRAIGRLMPPGAGGTSLRNTAYFEGHAIVGPLLILACYAVAGCLLVLGADAARGWAAHRRESLADGRLRRLPA
jgi:hypothetical protein